MVVPFFICLLAVMALTLLRREPDQMKTAGALLANWFVCWLYAQYASGSDWRALFAIDYTTAVLLAIWSYSRPPLVVVGIYGAQCIAHAAVAYVGMTRTVEYYYLTTLSWSAWAQLAFLGVWTGGGLAGLLGRARDPAHGALANRPEPGTLASKDADR